MRGPFVPAGEKWHYSPLASRLAQSGIVACIVSYTLYPQASAQDMVAELSQALTWTLDNIHKHGGDPDQVLPQHHLWCLLAHLDGPHSARSAGGVCLHVCLISLAKKKEGLCTGGSAWALGRGAHVGNGASGESQSSQEGGRATKMQQSHLAGWQFWLQQAG